MAASAAVGSVRACVQRVRAIDDDVGNVGVPVRMAALEELRALLATRSATTSSELDAELDLNHPVSPLPSPHLRAFASAHTLLLSI